MRADRLVSLLLLLQNRGRMTATELAAELEVSVRTVYRDIEALSASGVPVRADRGPDGGYQLMNGYRTRLTGLTDAEAGSLFLTGAPGPARDLGLGAVLTTAQLKLRAALPAELADRSRRIQERFHLDAPAWFRDAEPVPFLARAAEAVWEQRILRVHYQRWRGQVHRELRPLGIVLKSGIWYLVALAGAAGDSAPGAVTGSASGDGDGKDRRTVGEEGTRAEGAGAEGAPGLDDVRTYRVARFLDMETAGSFERPDGFDLVAYWEESTRRLEARLHQGVARLRVSPYGQRLLGMMFGAVGTRALAAAGPPDADGWVVVEMAVESRTIAVGDLLRLGVDAEVLGPPELRRAVGDTVAVLAERYGPARTGASAVPAHAEPSPHGASTDNEGRPS